MQQYLDILHKVLINGDEIMDRTGTGTLSTFVETARYDLSKGFPLVTTKKVYWKGVVHELLWFLKGSTNTEYLKHNGVNIWNEWENEDGDLGPVYGKQWRNWSGQILSAETELTHRTSDKMCGNINLEIDEIDQIQDVIDNLKTNPHSRRHIVTAWNPSDLNDMALAPCHHTFQFDVRNNKLNCHLNQRSADLFLGVPFNIASYALLTHMVAQVVGLEVGEFVHTMVNCHIYKNHIDQVKLQLSRPPKELPKLHLKHDIDNIDDFEFENISLSGYKPHPLIKGKVSV